MTNVFLCAAIIFFFTGCTGTETIERNSDKSLEAGIDTSDDSSGEEIFYSMREAWEIAQEDALKWAADAETIKIMSTDNHDDASVSNGMNGKRRCWTLLFHSNQKETEYATYVIDGIAAYGCEVATPFYDVFSMDDFELDSTNLIHYLQGQLSGGSDWAWGFHFIVEFRYMNAESTKPQLTMTVRGQNSDGLERCMIYDPYSGELISIIDKVGFDENGNAMWEEVMQPSNEMDFDVESLVDTEKAGQFANMTREELENNKMELAEAYSVYEICVEYRFNPEEVVEALIDGIKGDKFAPFSECTSYGGEEWVEYMKAFYGENWQR